MPSGYKVVDEIRFGDQEVSQLGVASEWETSRAGSPTHFAELPANRGVR